MQLKHSAEFEDGEVIGGETEVIFEDYEHSLRAMMCKNLPNLDIAYDETVFPEQIILTGMYKRGEVDEIILSGLADQGQFTRSKPRIYQRVENVKRNKYL